MLCPTCGNPNREEARFCDSCGAPLEKPEAPPTQTVAEPTPAQDTPQLIGGRFRVVSQIGDSSRRQVLLAHDEREDMDVALTLFSPELMGEGALARSRREISAMERLGENAHVVPVLETGEHDGRPFVVSMHMAGGDMRSMLAAAPGARLEIAEAIAVAVQICNALEHAHACGIVHRDLKPANVWLDDEGNARLGGFGLSSTGPARGGGVLVGTVAYLPPEQALGQTSGPRADLYSLGALIYEMVSGQPPFSGDDAVAIISQHLNSEPVPPSRHNPAVPAALDELVAALLAKRPQDRPASAAEVREALEAIDPEGASDATAERSSRLDSLAGGIFVGRDPELGVLRRAADSALAGSGRLVLVAGEPGIGKTRIAEELSTYARLGGAKVHWGRCHEDEAAPAYWPWVQAIRSYARESDPVALAWEMGRGMAEIARIVPEVAQSSSASTIGEAPQDEQGRFRLFDAVDTFLGAAATSRPLVIVLDDLHWADESSLRLLEFCVRGLVERSLLIVGTYRDVELGRHHPLSRILAELNRSDRTTGVVLRGLDEGDVRRYIEMTTGEKVDPVLAGSVQSQTEGNPFFVAELVRLLALEGDLDAETVTGRPIPQGVRDVIGRRLDSLSPEANRALGMAAAVGREFDLDVLAELLGEGTDVDAVLTEARRAQLLEPDGPGSLRFTHALVRETLYRELDAAERPLLHRDIAAVLERVYAGDPVRFERNLGVFAHHYLEAGAAGDPAKTVVYATRAGRRAYMQLGYEEAVLQFRRALTALELVPDDPRRRLDLLLSLGEAETRVGGSLDAYETLKVAAALAREIGDPGMMVRASQAISTVLEVGRIYPEVVELIEETLEAIEPGDSRERVELLTWLAMQTYWEDPSGRAERLFEEAVAMARAIEDEWVLAFALTRRGPNEGGPFAERVEGTRELLEVARSSGDRELEARAHVQQLTVHLGVGDIAAVDRELAEYERLAHDRREPQQLWHVPMLQAMRKTIDGDFKEAENLAERSREEGRRVQEPIADQFYAIQASYRFRLQGRIDEIIASVEQMTERYPGIPAWRAARAGLRAESGDLEAARADYESLVADDFAAVPRDAQWLVSLVMLSDIAMLMEDPESAERIHTELEPYAGEVVVIGPAAATWGPVDRARGLASAAAGNLDRAAEELGSALEMAEGLGDRPFAARLRLDLARVLISRDRTGERARAIECLDACLEAALEIGMRALSERALALKLETQGIAEIDTTTSIGDVIEAVETERPDIRGFAASDGTVTILFSDIESSTAMTERLGDERWLAVLRDHNRVFRERLIERGGYEVKNQGDGFMLAFPDPAAALECAVEVQRDFAGRAAERPEEALRVRMGLHTGEAIAEEGDFFGRNVILAARIAAEATGGEILISDALRERVDGEVAVGFEDARQLELKGLAGHHQVFAVQL